MKDFNNIVKELDINNIYGTLYPITAEYLLFSSTPGT